MASWMPGLSNVDPHAWMMSLPVLLAMLAVALQPSGSALRRWAGELHRTEAMVWATVTRQVREEEAPAWPAWQSGLLCAATTALTLATLLSMARFAGLLG